MLRRRITSRSVVLLPRAFARSARHPKWYRDISEWRASSGADDRSRTRLLCSPPCKAHFFDGVLSRRNPRSERTRCGKSTSSNHSSVRVVTLQAAAPRRSSTNRYPAPIHTHVFCNSSESRGQSRNKCFVAGSRRGQWSRRRARLPALPAIQNCTAESFSAHTIGCGQTVAKPAPLKPAASPIF